MYKRLCSLLAKADWSDNDVDMICSIVNKNPEFLTERLRDNYCAKCSMFRDRLTCKCEEVIIIPAFSLLNFLSIDVHSSWKYAGVHTLMLAITT